MGSGRLYASVPISGSVWLRTKRMARDLKGVDLRSGSEADIAIKRHDAKCHFQKYLGIGEEEAARASIAEFLKQVPNFSIAAWKRIHPTRNPVVDKQRERIFEAWRNLGSAR